MKRPFGKVLMIILILLLFHSASYAFNLPDTDQILCYNATGTAVSCTNTGQDGEYVFLMSFTNNGDGTVTDNDTELMWQRCSVGQNNDANCTGSSSDYNWYRAKGAYNATYNNSYPTINICGNLTLGTYTDWRLPTKKELVSISKYSAATEINTTLFPNSLTGSLDYYWAADIYAGSETEAWIKSFNGSSGVGNENMADPHYVRCVRGAKSEHGFIDNGNGTVTDVRTCLVWQQAEQSAAAWTSAVYTCDQSTLAGQGGWRLPNIKELESLADESRHDPALDTNYFPGVLSVEYWSSTTRAVDGADAWTVTFSSGGVHSWNAKSSEQKFRCVRGGQSAENFVKLMRGVTLVNFYDTLQAAYAVAATGDVVQAKAIVFIENQTFSRNVSITLNGGYDCGFSSVPGFTTVRGSLIISNGTVTVANLIIK